MRLEQFGWNVAWEQAFAPFRRQDLIAGRVTRSGRGPCLVVTAAGEATAPVAGRLLREDEAPVAGDWVALRPDGSLIEAVLPRRSLFGRKEAGRRTREQPLAANVDVVFLVMGLDQDFQPRRLERYLVQAWESGARPVVVLNKLDVCTEPELRIREARRSAPGAPVFAMSALYDGDLRLLAEHVQTAETAALLGSSGVGKSTIVNRLLGFELQATRPVREHDGRGLHTTTHRELIHLEQGWLLVDTPGLRELQLWSEGEGLEQAFPEIEDLAGQCRFRDCAHQGEPGCAVTGVVDEARLAGYHKLLREVAASERRRDQAAASEEKRRLRAMHRSMRRIPRTKW